MQAMTAAVTPSNWKQLLLHALQANSYLNHSSYLQRQSELMGDLQIAPWFSDETDRIQINTDSRTRKIEDLKHCPFAEICWYFTDSWEQFRINGMVDVIDGSNPDSRKLLQRENSWFASSLKSRMQYLSPDPGLPSIGEELPKDFCLDPSAGPVSAFCLLVLDPDKVDYLNVKTNTRLIFECSRTLNGDKCWTSEIINP